MRAWVARRREAGALLQDRIPVGSSPAPFELLIVEVTDQGQRRPTRVARLMPAGQPTAVAQLLAPRLVWCGNWQFVLTGTEVLASPQGQLSAIQSWQCKLAVPAGTSALRAVRTFDHGIEVPKRMLRDRFASSRRGQLAIRSTHDPALGRHTIRAELGNDSSVNGYPQPSLIDCELDWMSPDRFALSGFEEVAASETRPAALLRQGWLCEFDLPKAEAQQRTR